MFADGDICMLLNVGGEILIIKGFTKMGFTVNLVGSSI